MSSDTESGRVVCPEPLAAAAGGQILQRGGTAVDAIVAAAFVQGVVSPLMCGIGGTGRVLVYSASTGTTVIVDARGGAGEKAEPDIYSGVGPSVYPNRYTVDGYENYIGHKAVIIPTTVRTLWGAHRRFGHLPWSDLLQPAIELARNGFEVCPYIFQFWDPNRERFSDSPPPMLKLKATAECARIYLRDGRVYQVGEILKQEDYAATLQRIADQGAHVFYRGDIARAIADDFERNGGLITRQDLERCTVEFREPTVGSYRGYTVVTDDSPGMGPLEIEALNILEHVDLHSLGYRSVRYFDVLALVFQTIYADRMRYNGDPAFVDVPTDKFLSKDRARDLAQAILGGTRPFIPKARPVDSNTTHVSVLDGSGNAASLTHSNGNSSGVVTPGLGFLYNHHMHNFDPRPGHLNSIQPGKTPRAGCSPLMLFRNGKLRLISGGPSRFRVTAELQALVGMIDFGHDVQTAVREPRIHAEYDPETIFVEPAVSPDLVSQLKGLGWKPHVMRMTTPLCAIALDEEGRPRAAVDPRGGGGHWP
jgi:gamma-glutamyltranspeptidase/glutathione hydrolase